MTTVLIVDDDPIFRKLMVKMVEKLGYKAYEAANGLRGQEMALTMQPEITFMDLMMPIQDGYATSRNLREKGFTGRIIIMSALQGIWGSLETTLAQADGFLCKPISLVTLKEAIESTMKFAE
jgi:two-component system, OmpR family, response regulator RpaA